MVRRAIIVALFAAAVFVGFQFAPPETRETIQKQLALVQGATSDFYTSCSEHPHVTLTIERLRPYVAIVTEKISQASGHINVDPQASKQWLVDKTSQTLGAAQALTSTMFVDAKAFTLVMQSRALNSTMFVDAKAHALATYTHALNSTAFVDAKSYALATSSHIISRAEGLSSTQRRLLVGACFLAVVAILVVSCRRRRFKVNESTNVTAVVGVQEATPEVRTETGTPAPSSVLHRRRSRCDSPRPAIANDENEAPQSNRTMGSEAFLLQINSATSDELLALPGLGEKSVAKILKYRSKHGEIHEIDELVGKIGLSRVIVTKMTKVHGL